MAGNGCFVGYWHQLLELGFRKVKGAIIYLGTQSRALLPVPEVSRFHWVFEIDPSVPYCFPSPIDSVFFNLFSRWDSTCDSSSLLRLVDSMSANFRLRDGLEKRCCLLPESDI
jgi:hypothetical protein